MIPEAAVEAAAKALYPEVREEWRVPPDPWESIPEDDDAKIEAIALARLALEAAAPHMLSHEREQTRLAHLDAMVNRETKQAELAAAWNEGARAGEDNVWAGERPPTRNPYATSHGSDDET